MIQNSHDSKRGPGRPAEKQQEARRSGGVEGPSSGKPVLGGT